MNKEERRENGQGIFFGVIGVATLIIAMIGATLAYFTATAKSEEGAVSAKAAAVAIKYSDSQVVKADSLIPASEDVAKTAYQYNLDESEETTQCLDKHGRQVGSVYHFEVENQGTETSITGNFTIVKNEFTNLKYMVYDVTAGTPTEVVATSPLSAQASQTVSIFGLTSGGQLKQETIPASTTKKYDVVIYLFNMDSAQDEEQGKEFSATASIDVAGIQADSNGQIYGEKH